MSANSDTPKQSARSKSAKKAARTRAANRAHETAHQFWLHYDNKGPCNYSPLQWDDIMGFAQAYADHVRAALRSSGMGTPPKLNVTDVSRILVERTNGILWKEDADGNMSRLTIALNELLTSGMAKEPTKEKL